LSLRFWGFSNSKFKWTNLMFRRWQEVEEKVKEDNERKSKPKDDPNF